MDEGMEILVVAIQSFVHLSVLMERMVKEFRWEK